jgi:hypothetical protein
MFEAARPNTQKEFKTLSKQEGIIVSSKTNGAQKE